MSNNAFLKIKASIEESVKLKQVILEQKLYSVLSEIGEMIVNSILLGGKVLICGNVGSARRSEYLERHAATSPEPDLPYALCRFHGYASHQLLSPPVDVGVPRGWRPRTCR